MFTQHTLLWGLCSAALLACSPASDSPSSSRDNDDSAYHADNQPYADMAEPAPPADSNGDNDDDAEHGQYAINDNGDCQLTIGFDIWEPYQFIDIGERVRGLDVEIAQAAAQLMGCELEFQQSTWVDLLHDMQRGDVDVLMGASKTDERERFAYFSDGYRDEQFVLFIREDDQRQFNDMALVDVLEEGKRIGIVDSYFYGDEFQSYYDAHSDEQDDNGAQFVSAMMGEFNLVRLLDHDIDGFLEDRVVGHSLIRRKGLSDYITPADIELSSASVYVMFSRESTDEATVEAFNQALQAMRDNGQYDAIMQRYIQ